MARDIDMPTAPASQSPWGHLGEARSRWVVLLSLAVVVAPSLTLAALLFDDEAEGDGLTRIDQPVLDAAVSVRTPVADRAVEVYSYLGGPVLAIVATFLAVVGLSLRWRSRTPFLLMLVAGAGSLAMSMTTKAYADRARPGQEYLVGSFEPSWSFPSGHALNAVIIAGVLAYLFIIRSMSRRVAVVAVTLAVLHAVLMGLSRVYLGQHWLTDVIVAWCMGLVWLTVVLGIHQVFLRQRKRQREVGSSAESGRRAHAGAHTAP